MKTQRWDHLRRSAFTAEQIERISARAEEKLLELDLRDLRELLGKSQVEVAKIAEMTQSEISRVERRSDHRLSTLRRIVAALGGELEVVATFGNKRLKLRDAG